MDKKTRQQLRKIILEEVSSMNRPRKRSLSSYIFEEADPAKIDLSRFPLKLSDAAADSKMKDKTTKGVDDGQDADDTVTVNSAFESPVQPLKPSQSTMKVSNAVGMAIGMLVSGKIGGSLDAFISSDNYIMDGHHRWIATFMAGGGTAKVQGTQINLPGDKLVAVLNAITAGRLGNKGNAGKGSFADFQDKAKISAEIKNVVENGVPKFEKDKQVGYFTTPEDAKRVVDEKGGVDALADMFIKNLKGATLATPEWAVERIEMPVINPGNNQAVAKGALEKGEVDLNPPYAVESSRRNGAIVMERWQRLAGIIKG
jgi:hypothetical protein